MNNSRKRGILVYPVNPTLSDGEHISNHYCVGINWNTKEIYMIHNPEGVSYYVGHNKPFRFSDANILTKWYSPIDLFKHIDWTAPIDLADMIRSFGDRLENNFYCAHYALTTEEQRVDDDEHARPVIFDYLTELYNLTPEMFYLKGQEWEI